MKKLIHYHISGFLVVIIITFVNTIANYSTLASSEFVGNLQNESSCQNKINILDSKNTLENHAIVQQEQAHMQYIYKRAIMRMKRTKTKDDLISFNFLINLPQGGRNV